MMGPRLVRTVGGMAIAVVLVPCDGDDVTIGPDALSRLAALGVTSVAVLRDADAGCAVVLEGWAFDPNISAVAATGALGANGARARLFHPIAQMTVSSAGTEV